MTIRSAWKMAGMVVLLGAATAIGAAAQTFTSLATFDFTNGANPSFMSLVQGIDGNLYGTTVSGGNLTCIGGCGTVFRITTGGALTSLYSFCAQAGCADGINPYAGVVQGTDGDLYGTTSGGGQFMGGTVFKISPDGTLTSLYSFCTQSNCADGGRPEAGLIQGTDGNFYGTTADGGTEGAGTVFQITSRGKLTTIGNFNMDNGANPVAGLVQATNGKFYGTAFEGGFESGTIFELSRVRGLTALYVFCSEPNCTDGANPSAGLVEGVDGNLYGTTYEGGANCSEPGTGCGTVFQLTAAGTLTTLYSFCTQPGCTDGMQSSAGLVQATDENFYGTTVRGGSSENCNMGCGTVFEITSEGVLTTLHSLANGDGATPQGGLLQATDGNFYGTTTYGGSDDLCPPYACGTVFRLATGLGPFVKALPAAGKVDAEIGILGTNLTGATSVTFNGTSAKFRITSPTLILTHVPASATTGKIRVTLPNGTLTSNVPFYLIP
jgi:uncharacterized repeat protein (TIGR03803 family)